MTAIPLPETSRQGRPHSWLLGVVFLLVWPAFIVLCVALILSRVGLYDETLLGIIVVRIYSVFLMAYVLIQVLQRLFPATFPEDKFWRQLVLHMGALVFVHQVSGPLEPGAHISQLPPTILFPLLFVFLQISLYVAIKTLVFQRDQNQATQLRLRQSEVNVLRSQTNPHFLFNTLNLLASEVGHDPANAKEIIYDLSDLLRDSMRAAEQEFLLLEEEVRLVKLYLTLQQKRFPDRLNYEILLDDQAGSVRVPSLILQPVVENVIKHVVSRSDDRTQLRLDAAVEQGSLVIRVGDNGSNPSGVIEAGNGLRILSDTLALHYQRNAILSINSGPSDTEVRISIPVEESAP